MFHSDNSHNTTLLQSCAFTGHRPERMPWGTREDAPGCVQLKETIQYHVDALYQRGVRHFITGMALGSDQYAGDIVLALRDQDPSVTLEAAVPCIGQAKSWKPEQVRRYQEMLSRCDKVTYVSQEYSHSCMMKRNRYMVDHAHYLVAIFDGSQKGGTYNTIHYGEKVGRAIVIIPLEKKVY